MRPLVQKCRYYSGRESAIPLRLAGQPLSLWIYIKSTLPRVAILNPCLPLPVRISVRAFYHEISFCAPKGRIAPIGASRLRRSLTARLRRDGLIPKKTYHWPCFTLPLHLPGALIFARPKGALRLSARLIGGGWFYSESMILSRIDYLIPHYIREPRGE